VRTYSLFGHIPVGSDRSLYEFTLSLSLRIYPIAIDSIYLSFLSIPRISIPRKLYHLHQSGSNPRIIWAYGPVQVPQKEASQLILLSLKYIRIESIYNQLSADTLFVIFRLLILHSSWPVKLTQNRFKF